MRHFSDSTLPRSNIPALPRPAGLDASNLVSSGDEVFERVEITTNVPSVPLRGEAPGRAPGLSGASTPGVSDAQLTPMNSATLNIFHLNPQGLTPRNLPKFMALIASLDFPDIVAVTETWMKPHYLPCLPPYHCIEKRNRPDGRGGMALFAKNSESVVCIHSSLEDERLWFLLHVAIGPILLCLWYRPGIPETDSCVRFRTEFESLCERAAGFLCIW